MKYIIVLITILSGLLASEDKSSMKEVFKENRISQGNLYFEQASKYFSEKNYKACIEKNRDFLLLYPNHQSRMKVMKLLSEAYWEDDQSLKSIETDIEIYRNYPTIEEGLNSYLNAARKYIKMGRVKKGKKILETIQNQMYSKKLAKDAEIEIEQIKILEIE